MSTFFHDVFHHGWSEAANSELSEAAFSKHLVGILPKGTTSKRKEYVLPNAIFLSSLSDDSDLKKKVRYWRLQSI